MTSDRSLPGRHAEGAVETNRFSVDDDILDDMLDQRRILARVSESRRKRNLPAQ